MRQLNFIPSDFDTLDAYDKSENGIDGFSIGFHDQYTKPSDCPIARATKRALGVVNVSVNMAEIEVNGESFFYPFIKKIGIVKVAKIEVRVKKNGKATVNLGVDIHA